MCVCVCVCVCIHTNCNNNSVLIFFEGKIFFEIIALTITIHWHAICLQQFLIEVDTGFLLVHKNRKFMENFCRWVALSVKQNQFFGHLSFFDLDEIL